jgi:hypothetical protein
MNQSCLATRHAPHLPRADRERLRMSRFRPRRFSHQRDEDEMGNEAEHKERGHQFDIKSDGYAKHRQGKDADESLARERLTPPRPPTRAPLRCADMRLPRCAISPHQKPAARPSRLPCAGNLRPRNARGPARASVAAPQTNLSVKVVEEEPDRENERDDKKRYLNSNFVAFIGRLV